jgi:hypothetical protein
MGAGNRKNAPVVFVTTCLAALSVDSQDYNREGDPPRLAAHSLFEYRHLQRAAPIQMTVGCFESRNLRHLLLMMLMIQVHD